MIISQTLLNPSKTTKLMVLVSVETTSAVTWPIIINATKITAWKIYHSKKN